MLKSICQSIKPLICYYVQLVWVCSRLVTKRKGRKEGSKEGKKKERKKDWIEKKWFGTLTSQC